MAAAGFGSRWTCAASFAVTEANSSDTLRWPFLIPSAHGEALLLWEIKSRGCGDTGERWFEKSLTLGLPLSEAEGRRGVAREDADLFPGESRAALLGQVASNPSKASVSGILPFALILS